MAITRGFPPSPPPTMSLPGPRSPRLFFHLQVLFVLFSLACSSDAYFANWGDIGRAQEPTCVDIPKNMSLCSNIQYERMRLPNLLAHDTLTEVAHQSSSWVPLLNVRCHPDTQLFLCSLFTPVCLERPIFPCRSLCVAVQTACEKRMTTYGYHWPDMLRCENFPEDNDMCLKAQHTQEAAEEHLQTETPETVTSIAAVGCEVCNPVPTYENILDHFCRADFVLRLRIKALRHNNIIARKARVYKPALPSSTSAVDPSNIRLQRRALRKPRLLLDEEATCCSDALPSQPSTTRYLIMGKNSTQGLVPTFVLPWSRSKSLREAVRVFDGLDCSDPSLFTPDTQSGAILNTGAGRRGRNRGRGRRGRGNKRRKANRREQEAGTDLENPAPDSEVEEGGNRRGGGRGSNRRGGGGGRGGGRRNGRRREDQGEDDESSTRNDRRERQKRRKEAKKNGRGRSGDQSQRLGEEEKERRKQFIRRKMEQSRVESNDMEESGANI